MELIRNFFACPVLAELEVAMNAVTPARVRHTNHRVLLAHFEELVARVSDAIQAPERFPRLQRQLFHAALQHELHLLDALAHKSCFEDSLKRLAAAIQAVGERHAERVEPTVALDIMRHNMSVASGFLNCAATTNAPVRIVSEYDDVAVQTLEKEYRALKERLRNFEGTQRFEPDYPTLSEPVSHEFEPVAYERTTPDGFVEFLERRFSGSVVLGEHGEQEEASLVVQLVRSVDWLRLCVKDLAGYNRALHYEKNHDQSKVNLMRALATDNPARAVAALVGMEQSKLLQWQANLIGHVGATNAVNTAARATVGLLKLALGAHSGRHLDSGARDHFEERTRRLYCLLADEALVCARKVLLETRRIPCGPDRLLCHINDPRQEIEAARAIAARIAERG